MVAGLEYFVHDPSGTAEKESPSKNSVQRYATVSLSELCFTNYSNSQEKYFDFEELDSMSIEEHLARVADAEDSDDLEEVDDWGESRGDEEDA